MPRSLVDPLNAFPEELNAVLEEAPIAYIPFGTVEWHGPHLPLGVDTYKIEALCREAVSVSGGVVLPTVSWNRNTVRTEDGVEYEGMEYFCRHLLPGNFHYIREETMLLLLEDMVDCLMQRGFKAVCIWSGHTPSCIIELFEKAEAWAKARYPGRGICFCGKDNQYVDPRVYEHLALDFSMDHAGRWETSMMMAIKPERVKMETLEERDLDKLCMTNNGVLDSSAEVGQQLIEVCGQGMGRYMKSLVDAVPERVSIPQPMPEAGL